MNLSMLELLECPYDRHFPLTVATVTSEESPSKIREGEIRCERCRRTYPIREGILSMLPDPLRDDRADAAATTGSADTVWHDKLSEMRTRDLQAPEYDRFVGDYLERAQAHHVVTAIKRIDRGRVLDLGAGTGRLTLQLRQRASELIAVDFSLTSLKTLADRTRRDSRHKHAAFDLVQADASFLPFRNEVFDTVISAHVMHHVPLPARTEAFSQVRRVLRPKGRFILTVYHYDLYRRVRIRLGLRYPDIEKDGYHGQRIYYHCFTRRELRTELERLFDVERLQGIVTVPREIFSRLERSPMLRQAAGGVDRLMSRTMLGSSLGLLLFAIGRRR